jgi:hypothetical protein
MNIDTLTAIAKATVEDHIQVIRDSALNQKELSEGIYNLARDSVLGNGGSDSQAAIIAGYIRTQF